MLMREELAKERWCPFARAQMHYDAGAIAVVNRSINMRELKYVAHSGCMCLGSDCMAWRVGRVISYRETDSGDEIIDVDLGYCGLAGKPKTQGGADIVDNIFYEEGK